MRILSAALFLLLLAYSRSAAEDATPWLGIASADLTTAEAEALGWKASWGSKVVEVKPGSPAATAGLKQGDVITSFDGTDIQNSEQFEDNLAALRSGAEVAISLTRDKKTLQLTATIGSRPQPLADKAPQLALDTGGHQRSEE